MVIQKKGLSQCNQTGLRIAYAKIPSIRYPVKCRYKLLVRQPLYGVQEMFFINSRSFSL